MDRNSQSRAHHQNLQQTQELAFLKRQLKQAQTELKEAKVQETPTPPPSPQLTRKAIVETSSKALRDAIALLRRALNSGSFTDDVFLTDIPAFLALDLDKEAALKSTTKAVVVAKNRGRPLVTVVGQAPQPHVANPSGPSGTPTTARAS